MEKVVTLTKIAKSFGKLQVLKDINLEINVGEILGLIGPSGSGKSTIIKIALGMENADQGEAKIFGQTMPNRQLLAQIGYMAQTDALYLSLTGREILKFYAQMKGINRQAMSDQIAHVVDVVDLNEAIDPSNQAGKIYWSLDPQLQFVGIWFFLAGVKANCGRSF